ncbi:gluconate:H+ symporter [Bacillus inaquosorum]|uniref:gluconate:H+ symporter n=1 Tax=Bacillus inaquosorum TaxID=483913 RepID=UPI002282C147|nr:gluconate:H+ symporter [Bacillus inaquosorum]MCY7759750.1 gluconate:H+ symporter [Bacillus inaquosorum]MCY8377111.1 gluconate:H+ symporter [Bacillus inaquosorum]MCY8731608.1 gluconate:H+ symporter [Bacillus inaquosorum]MCY9067429.1 gluconate:H+ symporter [Bacillus inaquosorum]MCY9273410.1 gluconate:H+ symporter [Bacillus inaquosorum]
MPILIVAVGVLILLFLIIKVKLNTFVSLIIVSFLVAIGLGMDINKIVLSIEAGIGGQLGHLALVFGLGAMLGRLVSDAGGGYRIAITLIDKFGRKRIQAAVVIASFIIGIALFFEVGLVLLIPIVYAIAKELKMPFLYLGIPMAAALNVTHGFLPPHPAPTAISVAYGAHIGQVLLFGIIIAVPTTVIAGPLFNKFAMKRFPGAYQKRGNLSALGPRKEFQLDETPGFGISVVTSLFPVIFMAIATVFSLLLKEHSRGKDIIEFIGTPGTAMLISLLLALYTMGYARKIPMKEISKSLSESISQIAMMLLIIGGGGAFKQVLIDGGVGDYVADLFSQTNMSPLLVAWIIAAVLRLCLGSATVAALTTAGMAAPLMEAGSVNPALMVLATGAGSVIACHVNDAGFWMVKEFFGLSMKETFQTWTLLTTVLSVTGLGCVLLAGLVM